MPLISKFPTHEADMDLIPMEHEDENTKCPVCGSKDCEWIYIDDWGEIVGCDECLSKRKVGD